MSRTTSTSFAALLAGLLLLAMPAAARSGGEAATTAAAERLREAPRSTASRSAAERLTADPAMPAMLRLALTRSRADEVDPAYHLEDNGRGANPRHGFGLAFTPAGVQIGRGDGGFALRLERFGRGAGRPVRRAAPRIDGAWVEYDRGAGLAEWFVNLPRGVEQGWTVTERPAGSGPLVLELDTTRPPDESEDRRLAWSGLVYHRLVALDANGRELPAIWTQDGTRLRITVDDRQATYPVLIDPWIEEAKLTAADGAVGDRFAASVALEGDTALIGTPTAAVDGNTWQGAVYVFTRSGAVWSQQAKLVADDGGESDTFGDSVALDGDVALVGASFEEVDGISAVGAAYVFTRSGGTWTQQAKLTPDDGEVSDLTGYSVALEGDTALVGSLWAGKAYVFTRNAGVWTLEAKLTTDDEAAVEQLVGHSVSLEGDTALVGAPELNIFNNNFPGAVYVFTRDGGVWSQQAKLSADDEAVGVLFGASVSLAGDTALVGADLAEVDGNQWQGAAYVFTRSNGTWSQQAKLVADDGAAGDQFGTAVTVAGDTALVGAANDDAFRGSAYVWIRSGEVWSQQAKLVADDGGANNYLGTSVILADDMALAGAPGIVNNTDYPGAAYVYRLELSFAPAALAVDPVGHTPEANGVFEPGEAVDVAPAWRNDDDVVASLAGTASSFTGPPGATYSIDLDASDYGLLQPAAIADCLDTEVCYRLALDDPAARPATHWDATFDETLDDPDGIVKTWTLHFGDSFPDVPRTHLFYSWIETVLHHGVTSGCGEPGYCPLGTSTRGQMSVFVLRAFLGSDFMPDPCVEGQERFDDVPAGHLFCPWIEELAEREVVSGCGGGNYCPEAAVTRAQMAIFLLKTLEGSDYTPPECSGIFADVNCPSIFAAWVEELYSRGITTGCTEEPLNYCPSGTNIRGQMAVFLARTFGLELYGP